MPSLLSRQIDFSLTPEQLLKQIDQITQPSPSGYPYSFQRLPTGKKLFINRGDNETFFHGGTPAHIQNPGLSENHACGQGMPLADSRARG